MTTLPQTLSTQPGDDDRSGGASHASNASHGGTGNGYGRYPMANNGYSAGPVTPVSGVPALSAPISGLPVAQAGGSGAQLTGGDVLRVLRENLWLIIVAFVISGVAGVGLNEYLKKDYLTYTATGQLLLKDTEAFDPLGDTEGRAARREEQKLEVRLQTQVAGLKSDQLFDQILQGTNPVTSSGWLRRVAGRPDGSIDPDRAREALLKSFNASPREGSQLINVSFDADQREEARDILHFLVESRREAIRQRADDRAGLEITEMEKIVRDRQQEINRIDSEIRTIQNNQGGDSETAASMMALSHQISQLSNQKIEVSSELNAAQEQLNAAREAISRGVDPSSVQLYVDQNPDILRTRAMLEELEMTLESESANLGVNHPQIQSLQRRRDVLAARLRDREDNARATARGQLVSQLEQTVASGTQAMESIDAQIMRLDQKLREVSQDNQELTLLLEKKQALETALAANQTVLDVRKRGAVVQPEQPLDWFERPTLPTGPSFPNLPVTVGACMFLGVSLAVGAALLREVLDTSVKSPRDVIRAGQMNVLGIIPEESDDPEAAVGDNKLELTIANAPHSMTAEQFRIVRSRLAHVAPLESTRSLLVTSPQPGDGKTTVACNLAAGMALNGRRVLLVDANFRRPGVHSVFDLPNDRGLSACLEDADVFDEAVIEVDNIPNLAVLPAGPKPLNATELIEGANFTDVLDRALEQYDLVIFDSGPVLFVSETGALAPQVDGVISVVRARQSSRGLLGRLRDSLRSLNVEHLGVVLNAVQARAGGYYNRNMKTYYRYQANGRS